MGNVKIIAFVLKRQSMCRSRYEADLAVSVVSFILNSMGYIAKSSNLFSVSNGRGVLLFKHETLIYFIIVQTCT
jgi:hypothetical protein